MNIDQKFIYFACPDFIKSAEDIRKPPKRSTAPPIIPAVNFLATDDIARTTDEKTATVSILITSVISRYPAMLMLYGQSRNASTDCIGTKGSEKPSAAHVAKSDERLNASVSTAPEIIAARYFAAAVFSLPFAQAFSIA